MDKTGHLRNCCLYGLLGKSCPKQSKFLDSSVTDHPVGEGCLFPLGLLPVTTGVGRSEVILSRPEKNQTKVTSIYSRRL